MSRSKLSLRRIDNWLDAAVAGFALFTLIAHATVGLGGNLHHLLTAATCAAIALAGLWLWVGRGGSDSTVDPENSPQAETADNPDAVWTLAPGVRIAAATWAVGVVCVYAITDSTTLLWWGLAGFGLLTAAASLAPAPRAGSAALPRADAPGAKSRAAWLLLGIAAVCALIPLLVHHPDHDDAFYLNLSVAIADHPADPILAHDTLHGLPDVPLALPTYRVHSFELISAALAYLLGMEVLPLSHLLLPALAAFLLPFALARSFRLLTPERWLWSVVFAVVFLLAAGESPYSFGRMGFVRLHQGKAILVTLLVPLIIAYAIEFIRRPGRRTWLCLAAAQIAAVGTSASALWLAPVIAALALTGATAAERDRSLAQRGRLLGFGLLASAYVVAVAFGLRAATQEVFDAAAIALPSTRMSSATLARESIRYVLWVGPFAYATLALALLSFATSSTVALQRVVSSLCLGLTLVFWNPYTAEMIASQITGAPTYWRVLWILPIPLLVGASLSAIVAQCARLGGREGRAGHGLAIAAAGTLIVALSLAPQSTALFPSAADSKAWIGAPSWKIPHAEREAALELRRRVPAGASVLAPLDVSVWLPTLRHHPDPLMVRAEYLSLLANVVDADELNRRLRLTNLVSGTAVPPHASRMLAEAIEQIPLLAVCLVESVLELENISAVLEQSGMRPVARAGPYQVWAKVLSSAVVASDTGTEGGFR